MQEIPHAWINLPSDYIALLTKGLSIGKKGLVESVTFLFDMVKDINKKLNSLILVPHPMKSTKMLFIYFWKSCFI